MKTAYLILLFLVLGCVETQNCSEGQIRVEGECCADENQNAVCDDQEMERLVLVVNPAEPTCADGIMNQEEQGIDCGGPCAKCEIVTYTTTTMQLVEPTIRPTNTVPPRPPGQDIGYTPAWIDQGNGSQGANIPGSVDPGVYDPRGTSPIFREYSQGGIIDIDYINSSFCRDSSIRMTNTNQDGYVSDDSDIIDGLGDRVGLTAYNVVGDIDDRKKNTPDDRYRTILAFPITGLTDSFDDAKLNILPYLSQGTIADIKVEHVQCDGHISKDDYSSESQGYVGVIVKASDKNEMIYGLDITEFLLDDVKNGRAFSCYRLYWEDADLDRLDNSAFNRKLFYGYGSGFAPYITFIRRPCVRCEMNTDCGEKDYVRNYECNDNKIIRQYVHFRCADPATDTARCVVTQEAEQIDECNPGQRCTDGENTCYPEHCYDGENQSTEEGVDCGDSCRPCHCFNRRQDRMVGFGESEKGLDCGGECRPCVIDNRLPFVTIEKPNSRTTYTSSVIQVRYRTNKRDMQCFFNLEGGINSSIYRQRDVNFAEGKNILNIHCNDSFGKLAHSSMKVTVMPSQTMICPKDDVRTRYDLHFDDALFYVDDIPFVSSRHHCNMSDIEYALSANDSFEHTNVFDRFIANLSDGSMADYRGGGIQYSCKPRKYLTAGYANIILDSEQTGGRMVAYFKEIRKTGLDFARWRIYPSENASVFYEIPFSPRDSTCNTDLDIRYQELDLDEVARYRKNQTLPGMDFRLNLYSRTGDAAISLRELEAWIR